MTHTMAGKELLWSLWPMELTKSTWTLLAVLFVIVWLVTWQRSRKYKLPPGPRPWPIIGNIPILSDTTRPLHQIITDLSKTYGPIFLIKLGAQNMVYVTDPRLTMEVLKEKDQLFSFRPPQLPNAKYLSYTGYQISLGPDGDYHTFFRKVMAVELLSKKRLQTFEVLWQEQAFLVKDFLHASQHNQAIDVHKALFTQVLNVITQLIFGKRLQGPDGSPSEWMQLIPRITQSFDSLLAETCHQSLSWVDTLIGNRKRMEDTFKAADKLLHAMLIEHIEALDALSPKELAEYEPKDFMDIMLLHRNGVNSKFISETSVKAVSLDLMLASTDTTVSTMEWALAELIMSPHHMRKAREELDLLVGKERFVNETDIENLEDLPFLGAVIKETLRKHSPVPWLLPHSNRKDGRIGGYDIPAESFIHVNVHGLSTSDDLWKDPFKFDPERFLSPSRPVDALGAYPELLPFGRGRRMCPGVGYAQKVMTATLARLIHSFDFGLPDGQSDIDMSECFGLVVARTKPLFVVPKTRLAPHVYKSV